MLAQANARVIKTIADLDAAIAKGNASEAVVAEYRMLVNLHIEFEAVKDQMIKDVMADNDFLRKQVHPSKSKLRAFFDRVEKLLILAAGVYLGKGL